MGLNYVDISVAPPIFTETTIIPGKQGIQGIQGISGVYVGENAPTEADGEYNVWIKTNGEEMDFRGNGIKGFTYHYGISNSQQQIPTDWKDAPPEMKDNAYAWTKIDIEMTNETVKNQTFYVVAKQGTPAGFDDSKCTATIPENDTWAENPTVTVTPVGDDNTKKGFQFAFEHLRGKGIKNVRALYAVHNHPKEAPEDSKFSTSLPEVVGQDNYLWTKVEVTVDGPNGGTVYALPFVSKTGDKGEKGDTGAPAGFAKPSISVDDKVGTPMATVDVSGPNTAKEFTFNFKNLRGATFIPLVSEAGILSWKCDNKALESQKPASLDMVGKIKTAFSGGCTFQVLNAAPPEGTPDTMISLVVDNNANA